MLKIKFVKAYITCKHTIYEKLVNGVLRLLEI